MEETQVEYEKILKRYGKYEKKPKLNSEKIWKIWKKDKLKSEMIWKIWKNASECEKIEIWKKIVKRYGKYGRK